MVRTSRHNPPLCLSTRFTSFASTLSNASRRLVTEVRPHDESLFSCIACTQDARGEPLLFAGTNLGSVLELAVDADEREHGGLAA